MSAYRYVLFPKGKQPTIDEVREWESYAGLLDRKFAYGYDKKEGGLAIAVDREVFDRAVGSTPNLESLLRKWQVRGCTLLDHLAFVKDSGTLRPVDPRSLEASLRRLPGERQETPLSAKELAASEAVGKSRLAIQRTLERQATLGRLAAWVVPLLIALVAILTIAAGITIRNRIREGNRERRQETIERVARDALVEPLAPQSANEEVATDSSAAAELPGEQ